MPQRRSLTLSASQISSTRIIGCTRAARAPAQAHEPAANAIRPAQRPRQAPAEHSGRPPPIGLPLPRAPPRVHQAGPVAPSRAYLAVPVTAPRAQTNSAATTTQRYCPPPTPWHSCPQPDAPTPAQGIAPSGADPNTPRLPCRCGERTAHSFSDGWVEGSLWVSADLTDITETGASDVELSYTRFLSPTNAHRKSLIFMGC